MKYKVAEAKKKAKLAKDDNFKMLCKIYCKSNSWAEFMVNSTLANCSFSIIDKFMFWMYYTEKNYGMPFIIAYRLLAYAYIFSTAFLLTPSTSCIEDFIVKSLLVGICSVFLLMFFLWPIFKCIERIRSYESEIHIAKVLKGDDWLEGDDR